MRRKSLSVLCVAFFAGTVGAIGAQPARYAKMAPLNGYLMAKDAEIALARSGAPPALARAAEVMVLGRDGYTTAVQGTNGFLCIVERGWGAATTVAEFWNPKVRAPICFNPAAARAFAPIYLMKTRLALQGKSPRQILAATDKAFKSGQLPPVGPGAMCYMLSRQQYLNDAGKNWHPHLMFFVRAGAAKTWGANLDGSPVIAADDPEEHVTIMMVWVAKWSDGSPGPAMNY